MIGLLGPSEYDDEGMHWRDRVISVIGEDGSVGSTNDVVITEVSHYVLARLKRRLRRVIWVEGEGGGVYILVFRNVDCVRPVGGLLRTCCMVRISPRLTAFVLRPAALRLRPAITTTLGSIGYAAPRPTCTSRMMRYGEKVMCAWIGVSDYIKVLGEDRGLANRLMRAVMRGLRMLMMLMTLAIS